LATADRHVAYQDAVAGEERQRARSDAGWASSEIHSTAAWFIIGRSRQWHRGS
jgi:hypothetical protein